MGVRRAVELVLDTARGNQTPLFTYGPLIHNPQVLNIFEEKGIHVINEIPENAQGDVIIRAHGIAPRRKADLEKAGFQIIDATCPRVIKVQRIIQRHAGQGCACIIIGDRQHPEVIGLLGYAGANGYAVDSLDQLKNLPAFDQAIIVAQTTQNTSLFEDVRQWVARRLPYYKIYNTICDSTEKRQAEVKKMAARVDAVVVVGGFNSGNTRRLVEIAAKAGKPAYHVQTEQDLDPVLFQDVKTVGISAGASTPNWIIRRVYRKLQQLPLGRADSLDRYLKFIQRALLLTNIYVALGAGFLCYACARLQQLDHYVPQILIAFLYVQSMHILNHLMERKSDRYNDPERAEFYSSHLPFLTLLALVAGGAGLLTAYTLGSAAFMMLLVMSVLGCCYNIRLLPDIMAVHGRYKRLKDIPGSKTILIALAWGIVTAVFPALDETGKMGAATVVVFLWSVSMVFARTVFFDILDIQGDRIVGKETLPILVGEKQSRRFLTYLIVLSLLLLLLPAATGLISPLAFLLSICPLLMGVFLLASEKELILPGFNLQFLVESIFVLAGLVSFFWHLAGAA